MENNHEENKLFVSAAIIGVSFLAAHTIFL